MERYLDPKNDLVFKKIFGQHPDLLQSFLNAILALDVPIQSLEYLSPELVPNIPEMKNTIVDVRCTDNNGRQFIVEMQMLWSESFAQRMAYNGSKTYVSQLDKGLSYAKLQPVYALSLVNQDFMSSDDYYHRFEFINKEDVTQKINFMEMFFVELKKFKAKNVKEKKLQILWLRFLSEINEDTGEIPQEFYENAELCKALEIAKESAYTKKELAAYTQYWDAVQTERTLIEDGKKEGKEEGRALANYKTIKKLEAKGENIAYIRDFLDVTEEEIKRIISLFE